MENAELTTLNEVAEALNKKYSAIKDFKVSASQYKINGGWYWMNYMFNEYRGNHHADYPFHEVFGDFRRFNGSLNGFFEYLDGRIQGQLKWQKNADEGYAERRGKKAKYQFDYSLIES